MNHTARLAVVATAVLSLAACGAAEAPQATVTTTATVTVTSTATAESMPSPTSSTSPSLSASPEAPAGMLAMGEVLTLDTLTLTVTGQTAESDFAGDLVRAWEVKACNTAKEEVNFSSAAWFAVTKDGGRISAGSISGDSALEPAYPAGNDEAKGRTAPGECLTGLIPFLPGDDIVELRYENYLGDRGTWSVGS